MGMNVKGIRSFAWRRVQFPGAVYLKAMLLEVLRHSRPLGAITWADIFRVPRWAVDSEIIVEIPVTKTTASQQQQAPNRVGSRTNGV